MAYRLAPLQFSGEFYKISIRLPGGPVHAGPVRYGRAATSCGLAMHHPLTIHVSRHASAVRAVAPTDPCRSMKSRARRRAPSGASSRTSAAGWPKAGWSNAGCPTSPWSPSSSKSGNSRVGRGAACPGCRNCAPMCWVGTPVSVCCKRPGSGEGILPTGQNDHSCSPICTKMQQGT